MDYDNDDEDENNSECPSLVVIYSHTLNIYLHLPK